MKKQIVFTEEEIIQMPHGEELETTGCVEKMKFLMAPASISSLYDDAVSTFRPPNNLSMINDLEYMRDGVLSENGFRDRHPEFKSCKIPNQMREKAGLAPIRESQLDPYNWSYVYDPQRLLSPDTMTFLEYIRRLGLIVITEEDISTNDCKVTVSCATRTELILVNELFERWSSNDK